MTPMRGCCDDRRWRAMIDGRGLPGAGSGGRPGSTGRARITGVEPTINGSFVNPLVEIVGAVEIGTRSFVAGKTLLHADDGRIVSLGDENNVQDNVYILARSADVHFHDTVSVAHHAVIENSIVGAFTFLGFRSILRDAVVEEGAMVMHGATVAGVTIRRDTITPIGAAITSQAEADALPRIEPAHVDFKHQVQAVNLEFVDGYGRIYREGGRSPLLGVGPNPSTSWNPAYILPRIGAGTTLAEFVRVVGDVRLGEGSSVGERTAIRADEGTPIVIGRGAGIGSQSTFHALRGSRIDVGESATIGDGNVIHGPLRIGDGFTSEEDVIVFRATVGDDVTVRRGAIVAGEVVIRSGAVVPEGAVVTTQAEADALPGG